MAEPERILIWSGWPIYSHNFIIPDHTAMIFGTHSQEALINMSIEIFLTFLAYFVSYSPFYNE